MNSWKLLTHRATAYFQAVLSLLFVGGYFFVLSQFLYGHVKVPGEHHDALQVMLGVLTANVGTVMTFWFARQRISGPNQSGATS